MVGYPPLILGSASPRRLALLRQLGIEPDGVDAPDVDETPAAREQPRAYALRLADAKLDDVIDRHERATSFVIAADTVVACGRRILPKPTDEAMANRHLELLSGRRHRVYTGVAVAAPDQRRGRRVVMTMVRFKRLAVAERNAYLASGEWRDKAGSYGIQGRAEGFVVAINGSYSNVVGLPLSATLDLLRGLGWRPDR